MALRAPRALDAVVQRFNSFQCGPLRNRIVTYAITAGL
jgi:hypothetical protein